MTRVGTPYFESFLAALMYYDGYGCATIVVAVQCKIYAGEIHIGIPPTKNGERVILDGSGRYFIEYDD